MAQMSIVIFGKELLELYDSCQGFSNTGNSVRDFAETVVSQCSGNLQKLLAKLYTFKLFNKNHSQIDDDVSTVTFTEDDFVEQSQTTACTDPCAVVLEVRDKVLYFTLYIEMEFGILEAQPLDQHIVDWINA